MPEIGPHYATDLRLSRRYRLRGIPVLAIGAMVALGVWIEVGR